MGKINFETLEIEELKKRFQTYNTISVDDFKDFYKDIFGDINKNTLSYNIYKLKKNKVIRHVSRGHYVLENFDKKDYTEYVVITMDIIKSSNIDSIKFNSELSQKVEELNQVITKKHNYKRIFYISQGDEIQILCNFNNDLSKLLILALCYLRPYKVRFGISFGQNNEPLKDNSWEMNGPIFWNARDCLNRLKDRVEYEGLIVSDNGITDKLCNNILPLVNKSLIKITDKQWEAIKLELSNVELEVALKQLKISKSSYYERLNTSNITQILNSLDAIFDIIKL